MQPVDHGRSFARRTVHTLCRSANISATYDTIGREESRSGAGNISPRDANRFPRDEKPIDAKNPANYPADPSGAGERQNRDKLAVFPLPLRQWGYPREIAIVIRARSTADQIEAAANR